MKDKCKVVINREAQPFPLMTPYICLLSIDSGKATGVVWKNLPRAVPRVLGKKVLVKENRNQNKKIAGKCNEVICRGGW